MDSHSTTQISNPAVSVVKSVVVWQIIVQLVLTIITHFQEYDASSSYPVAMVTACIEYYLTFLKYLFTMMNSGIVHNTSQNLI